MHPKEQKILLAFRKGDDGLFGRLIRWRTMSIYSHVELVVLPGRYGEAPSYCFSASWKDGGVRLKTISLDPNKWDLVALYPGPEWNLNDAGELMITAWGRPYDIFGAIAWGTPLKAAQRKKWFCSELLAAYLGYYRPWKYSPQTLLDAVLKDGGEFVGLEALTSSGSLTSVLQHGGNNPVKGNKT